MKLSHAALPLFGLLCLNAQAAQPVAPAASALNEAKFDALVNPAEIGNWIKTYASEPNHVGSPHDKANAEMTLSLFKEWGWDAKIETFKVLYPTPIAETVELLGANPHKATLTESPIKGDAATAHVKDALPAYVAFQGDGDVTAPVVYVNYGMPEDYKALERMGVSVKDKIVLARYGGGWRGLKPKLAYDHGAVGCLIYSDPKDDGYGTDAAYPNGPARPANGIQRGSVVDMAIYPGDPLTPGIGAVDGAKRLTRDEAPSILKIPALPISYGDAKYILDSLDGRVVPADWRGGLPLTYRTGGNGAPVHLMVKSDWSMKTIYNVTASLPGAIYPDQWVMRGNHRDGWVAGASDPLSGHSAMLAEAKALGALYAQGWRPKRTITYLSWDAEEPSLFGSTEFVETHEAELKNKGIVYINSDSNARGFFHAEGSFAFQSVVGGVVADLTDPETGASVDARRRARIRVDAAGKSSSGELKAEAKIAADPSKVMPLAPMGSGSDYSAFVQHAGIAAIDLGYGGEGRSGGVYHSAYDTYEHHSRFVDPGFTYDAMLAKTAGHLVMRIADADAPVQRYGDMADQIGVLIDEVKHLAESRRTAAATQEKLRGADAFRLAADPTLPSGEPSALPEVPQMTFVPLESAHTRLDTAAKSLDKSLNDKAAGLEPQAAKRLHEMLARAEALLCPDGGLPGRPWFRNLISAPGRFTGYSAKTLPGVREAIEEDRFADVDPMMRTTAAAITAYADALDRANQFILTGEVKAAK
jgi:N-acetylated-alpha-linked acidic dipeptidase